MKVKNVKKILATVITATLAIGVAGCASSTPEKTDDTGKTKVSMVIFSGGGQDTFDNAAAKFNEMQDEIELSIQPVTTTSIWVPGPHPMTCRICFGLIHTHRYSSLQEMDILWI